MNQIYKLHMNSMILKLANLSINTVFNLLNQNYIIISSLSKMSHCIDWLISTLFISHHEGDAVQMPKTLSEFLKYIGLVRSFYTHMTCGQ